MKDTKVYLLSQDVGSFSFLIMHRGRGSWQCKLQLAREFGQ
ncbi:hypothetical protein [Sphingobacterium kitahiroshimense]|uniref:Uncharacterized protein n=1 Tax=Sphingobacterium kitahiroshimense TaxID=470446 RepID=A0ABV0BW01_9SPHI